jgi:WD40 repeat protein
VDSVCFSPEGHAICAASGSDSDHNIRIWDADTGREEVTIIQGYLTGTKTVYLSHNGRHIATCSNNFTVRVWDVKTGAQQAVMRGHHGSVTAIAFSPDGRYLASGSSDRTVRMWDVETGKEKAMLLRDFVSADAIAFSPIGRWIAFGCSDRRIGMWDAETDELAVFRLNDDRITALAFSFDGRRLASGSYRNTLCIWDLNPDLRTPFQSKYLGRDGWMRDQTYEPLLWIPPKFRRGLSWPGVRVFSTLSDHRTSLDTSRYVGGDSWTQCFTGDASSSSR